MTQASHADDIATRLRHAVSVEEVLNVSFRIDARTGTYLGGEVDAKTYPVTSA